MPDNTEYRPAGQTSHPFASKAEIETQLDKILTDAPRNGLNQELLLDAVVAWAAGRAYDIGGYSAAKNLMLTALEDVLLRDASAKNAA
ncbi:MAG: hypothetical protein HC850_08330 [Rhodomicrobium sp.]|nr:hypothetical protein [Rhodomicrobium sp.]